jgi:superfamily II DNA or RNA helicase
MTAIALRPYQSAAVEGVRQAYAAGRRAPLLVLPTGGGKTTIFSYVTTSAASKSRCVYLIAHRAELVKQIAMTLARFGTRHRIIAPGPIVRQCQVEQFKAFGRTFVDPQARVFVASVQTLVKRLEDYPAPDLIVIDEAHHLTMDSTWGRVVSAYPDAKLLLVTATPCRLDGKGLGLGAGGFADELVMGPTMRELIDAGFLSPYRIFAPPNALDLSGVRTRMGDYAKDQLATAIDKPDITGDAVQHYQRLAAGKRAVAFCVSVAHAQHVAAEFAGAGVRAEFLDGTLDALERDRIIKRFEAGETLVLTSCDIISEGFDLPAIEVAILLRPTQSLSLYIQQVGRALRTFPGKREAIILDHVGAVATHGLPDEDREWSLDGVKPNKRAANDNDAPDVKITTCTKCFTIHLPAPECPTCGHVYPVRERKLEVADGELQELTADAMEALRRQKRAMQGQAQSIEQLVAQGISRPRAVKILQAREAKAALVGDIMDAIEAHRQATGLGVYQAWGVTLGDIRRLKPKELHALRDRISLESAQVLAA